MSLRRDEVNLLVTINNKSAGNSIEDLRKKSRDLQRKLNKLDINDKEFKKVRQELDGINKQLAEATGKARAVDRAMEGVGTTTGRLPAIFGKINTALNAAGILGLINLLVNAGRKLFEIGTESLSLYNTQAKADAQLKATLKSTGEIAGRTFEDLKKQASDLQNVTLFGDETTQQAQALLLTFTEIREEVFDETIPVIQDVATAMATASNEAVDLKGATIQIGKALNDPVKGVSALAEVGVSFSESQRSLIKNLVETGQKAKAQQVILAELRKEFGGSAKAAAEAGTGGMTQLRNKIGDLQEILGELMNKGLRVLAPLFNALVDVVFNFVNALTSGEKAQGRFSTGINIVVGLIKAQVAIWRVLISSVMGFANVLSSLPDIARTAMLQVTSTAALAAKQVELAFTFDDQAEARLKGEIEALRKFKTESKTTGEVLGAAFQEGYNKKILGDGAPEAAAAGGAGTTDGAAPLNPAAARAEIQKRVKAAQDAKIAALQAGFDRENLLLEGLRLNQEIQERAAAERKLDIERQFFEQKMALLRSLGQQESNEYLKLQNDLTALKIRQEQAEYLRQETATIESIATLATKAITSESIAAAQKLDIQKDAQQRSEQFQKDYLKQKEENERRTAQVLEAIEQQKWQVATGFFEVGVALLGKDEAARKKNASTIKAFEKARILVNLAAEISNLFKNYSAIPFVGQVLAIAQAGLATGRAVAGIRSIDAQKFAAGGFTGQGFGTPDTTGHRPAGIVHAGEWVAPAWMVNQHAPSISALERIRQRGYASGGFVNTTPTAAPPPVGAGEQQAIEEARLMRMEFSNFRAEVSNWQRQLQVKVAYTDIEDVGDTLTNIRADASL